MSMELIQRLASGYINQVNDSLAGGGGGNIGPQVGLAPGQLGKILELDDSELSPIVNTVVGTVYGGEFQYVLLAPGATAVVVGQLVFWDTSVADSAFQVTTNETTSSTNGAMMRAGIVLNPGWGAGNYSYIQRLGPTFVQMRAVLTSAGVKGNSVYCAAVGAGADNGFADQLNSANPTLFSDVQLMQGRYIGSAIGLPANGSLTLVNVNFANVRG